MQTSLQNKTDCNLISDLKELVSRERELLTHILHLLREIEARKIHLLRGHTSLFAFLTEEVGYSEAAAQRRIQAMRLMKDVPEIETKLEKGGISLTVAAQVQSFLRVENHRRKEENQPPISRDEKLSLIQELEGSSSRACEQKLAAISPEACIPKEKTRAISETRTLLQFSANQELMGKINKLKNLLSHQNTEGSLEKLFEKIADIALEKLDPERREKRRAKRKILSNPANEEMYKPAPAPAMDIPKQKSRYIPRSLRDRIWVRDQGRCQYRDKNTGKQCGAREHLALDHIFPFALDGEHSEENLQLKCRAHNQFRAELLFG